MASLDQEIVVVDDDQGILEAFDVMLGDDYDLVTMDDGCEAVEYAKAHNPKLIFLDIKMPGMNGIEVLRTLRRANIKSKIVMVTATTQPHYQVEAEDLGITAYLHKPFEIDDVEDIARLAFN